MERLFLLVAAISIAAALITVAGVLLKRGWRYAWTWLSSGNGALAGRVCAAPGDGPMVRKITYQETINGGTRTRVYELLCPWCKNAGTATYSWDEKGGYWHMDRLTGDFNHNEYSRGGAEVYCPHEFGGCLLCDPNGTGNPDDVCHNREEGVGPYGDAAKTQTRDIVDEPGNCGQPDNNKRNLEYFEASSMAQLFDTMNGWQIQHNKRFLSVSIERDGDKFCCIGLTNPSEVVIMAQSRGSSSRQEVYQNNHALLVEQ